LTARDGDQVAIRQIVEMHDVGLQFEHQGGEPCDSRLGHWSVVEFR
jgi:hypothetical protein